MILNNASSSIDDELPRGSMGADPYFINGGHEDFLMFACYLASGMPPRTTIDEVEDDLLADEK